MPSEVETFQVEGHIVDSLILAKVLDLILDAGATTGSSRWTSARPPPIPAGR